MSINFVWRWFKGANTVKYMEEMFRYAKTIIFFIKRLKVVIKCCLNWNFVFHGDLYCCVKYSNIEYQDEIFKTYH